MGLISLLTTSPIVFFIIAIILVLAITIHEFAHAWTADHLGDPTPRYQGRVTLNPLSHLDPLGTALLFFVGFGWGKPVQFAPLNLKNPTRDAAVIALAGPVSNLLFALVIVLIVPFLGTVFSISEAIIGLILQLGIAYNCMLAIFNLVPVYPLDGSKILFALLPRNLAWEYDVFMNQYGTIVLLALIFPFAGVSAVSLLISPVIDFVTTLYYSLAYAIWG